LPDAKKRPSKKKEKLQRQTWNPSLLMFGARGSDFATKFPTTIEQTPGREVFHPITLGMEGFWQRKNSWW